MSLVDGNGRQRLELFLGWLPESSKGVKLESLHHQKQTQGLKVDTLGGSEYVVCVSWAAGCHQNKSQSESSHLSGFKKKDSACRSEIISQDFQKKIQ